MPPLSSAWQEQDFSKALLASQATFEASESFWLSGFPPGASELFGNVCRDPAFACHDSSERVKRSDLVRDLRCPLDTIPLQADEEAQLRWALEARAGPAEPFAQHVTTR